LINFVDQTNVANRYATPPTKMSTKTQTEKSTKFPTKAVSWHGNVTTYRAQLCNCSQFIHDYASLRYLIQFDDLNSDTKTLKHFLGHTTVRTRCAGEYDDAVLADKLFDELACIKGAASSTHLYVTQ